MGIEGESGVRVPKGAVQAAVGSVFVIEVFETSPQEISDAIGGLVEVIVSAESGDKADLYRELGLRLTYRPQKQLRHRTDR